jgi:hypothetical protein
MGVGIPLPAPKLSIYQESIFFSKKLTSPMKNKETPVPPKATHKSLLIDFMVFSEA